MIGMMQKPPTLSSYHFKRTKTDGLIQVLNEGSYVMAEYSERTGVVRWQRVVLATQKEKIERWLGEHYPVQAPPAKTAPVRGATRSKVVAAR